MKKPSRNRTFLLIDHTETYHVAVWSYVKNFPMFYLISDQEIAPSYEGAMRNIGIPNRVQRQDAFLAYTEFLIKGLPIDYHLIIVSHNEELLSKCQYIYNCLRHDLFLGSFRCISLTKECSVNEVLPHSLTSRNTLFPPFKSLHLVWKDGRRRYKSRLYFDANTAILENSTFDSLQKTVHTNHQVMDFLYFNGPSDQVLLCVAKETSVQSGARQSRFTLNNLDFWFSEQRFGTIQFMSHSDSDAYNFNKEKIIDVDVSHIEY